MCECVFAFAQTYNVRMIYCICYCGTALRKAVCFEEVVSKLCARLVLEAGPDLRLCTAFFTGAAQRG